VACQSLALPHGRATEQAEAQVSSPRISKGGLNAIELRSSRDISRN